MARIPNADDANGVWNIRQQRDAQYGGEWPELKFWYGDRLIIAGGQGAGIYQLYYGWFDMSSLISGSDWTNPWFGQKLNDSGSAGYNQVAAAAVTRTDRAMWMKGYWSGGWPYYFNHAEYLNPSSPSGSGALTMWGWVGSGDGYMAGMGADKAQNRWIFTGGINYTTDMYAGNFDDTSTNTLFAYLNTSNNDHVATRSPDRCMVNGQLNIAGNGSVRVGYMNPMSLAALTDWGYNNFGGQNYNNGNISAHVAGRACFGGGGSNYCSYWNPSSAGSASTFDPVGGNCWGSTSFGGNYNAGDNNGVYWASVGGNQDANGSAYVAIASAGTSSVGNTSLSVSTDRTHASSNIA